MDHLTSSNDARCLPAYPRHLPVISTNLSNILTYFNQTPPINLDGQLIKGWIYFYQTCNGQMIQQRLHESVIECKCLDSWNECTPECALIKAYNTILMSLASAQIFICILGIILNSFVIIPFCRSTQFRRRNANILIFNQAVADLANCIVYGMPNAICLLIASIKEQEVPHQFIILQTTMAFTIVSSVLTFTVIAIERYLSISRPLWHKTRVLKKHIYISILILWILSTIMATIRGYSTQCRRKNDIYLLVAQVLIALLISLVILIFILTFKAAYRAISNADTNNHQRNVLIMRKKIRLTIMFLMMFIIFNFGFIPILVADRNKNYLDASNQALLLPLCLTSVLNPQIVLCFTKIFLAKRGQRRSQAQIR